jgi:hypothetical protein
LPRRWRRALALEVRIAIGAQAPEGTMTAWEPRGKVKMCENAAVPRNSRAAYVLRILGGIPPIRRNGGIGSAGVGGRALMFAHSSLIVYTYRYQNLGRERERRGKACSLGRS